MKKTFLIALVALFGLTVSCEKWKKEKEGCDVYTYYSDDYRDTDHSYLGVHSSELDELYFHFYQDKDQSDSYKFVGEIDGDYVYHEGTYSKSGNTVNFVPNDNSHPNFDGEFLEDGKTLIINYPGVDDARVPVTFMAKEVWDYCSKKDKKK